MDVVLEFVDTFVADHAFALAAPRKGPRPDWTYTPASQYINVSPSPAAWESFFPRDNMMRQAISLFFITWIFGMVLYFVFATLSYVFIFDKRTKYHPRYLKNQISMEIRCASEGLFFMAFLTAPIFLAEVRGYGMLYDSLDDAPFPLYNWIQIPFFLFFTDVFIYFIHRGLHHPLIYKFLHKPHHKWIMPTPFASHAFHPVDGWAQSLPYHIFPLLFPLQKTIYVFLFVFVNFWTIMIHDGEYMSNNPVINGAACHSLHHSKFEVNYGQFTTFADRLGGTYRRPEAYMFEKELKMSLKRMLAESEAVDECVKDIEGDESRVYGGDAKKTR